MRAFQDRFGILCVAGYGSSENVIIMEPRPGLPKDALGVPQAGVDAAVVDPETGEERVRACFDADGRLVNGSEAIGEIVGRNVVDRFEGYYHNPEAEAERTRNGWYWSGDLGYRDEAGVFYFAGRAGEWLRVDSENFATAPVERIVGRFPGASGVAVYPVPDERTADDQIMLATRARRRHRVRCRRLRSLPRRAARPRDRNGLLATCASRRCRSAQPTRSTSAPSRAERWYTDDPRVLAAGSGADVPALHRRRPRRTRGQVPRVRPPRRDRSPMSGDRFPVDFSQPGAFLRDDYYTLLADLRSRNELPEYSARARLVTRYADIREIGRDPARFCSGAASSPTTRSARAGRSRDRSCTSILLGTPSTAGSSTASSPATRWAAWNSGCAPVPERCSTQSPGM